MATSKNVLHSFVAYLGGDYVEAACGQRGSTGFVDGFDTAVRDVLTEVTCKKCVKRIAAAMPSVSSWSSDSLWNSLLQAEQRAAVVASKDVARAKESLLRSIDEVLRLIDSARRDVEGERRHVERIDGTSMMSALDYASSIARCPSFIGSNLNISGLMHYAFEVDVAVNAARKGIDG